MVSEKVCRKCKLIVKGPKCPACGANDFTRTWKGVIMVNNPEGSEVCELLGLKAPGRYALWVK